VQAIAALDAVVAFELQQQSAPPSASVFSDTGEVGLGKHQNKLQLAPEDPTLHVPAEGV